jgi:hypothetical protein
MALTKSVVELAVTPEMKLYKVTVAFDSSYPASGGEPLDMTAYGREILFAVIMDRGLVATSAEVAYNFGIADANFGSGSLGLQVYTGSASGSPNAEVTSATDLSGLTAVSLLVAMKNLG